MVEYVGQYIHGCDTCNHVKSFPSRKVGKLIPNKIPACHWQVISVDMVGELPESKGYNAILVIMDRLSKRIHAVLTVMTVDSAGIAWLFLEHVWKHHGLPEEILSDRVPLSCDSRRNLRTSLASSSPLQCPTTPRQTGRQSE